MAVNNPKSNIQIKPHGTGIEKRLVTYVDSKLRNFNTMRLLGNYDASGNTFPVAGSLVSGGVKAGDTYDVIVGGTLGGVVVNAGATLGALIDSPGQTLTNWKITY